MTAPHPAKTTRHLDMLSRPHRRRHPAPADRHPDRHHRQAHRAGRSVMELDASGRHANPMGTLHGGSCATSPTRDGHRVFASTLEDDESFTTSTSPPQFSSSQCERPPQATRRSPAHPHPRPHRVRHQRRKRQSQVAKVFSSCMVLAARTPRSLSALRRPFHDDRVATPSSLCDTAP